MNEIDGLKSSHLLYSLHNDFLLQIGVLVELGHEILSILLQLRHQLLLRLFPQLNRIDLLRC